MSAVAAPKLVTASRDAGAETVTIYADGVATMRLPERKVLWLMARLAEAMAAKP